MKVQEQRADYFVIPKTGSAVFKAARLGDVTDSMKNGLYKPASEYGDDGVPCLRMYNIDAGKIAWRDIKRMRVSASELEDYGLIEGDLLVNRVNSRELVGKTALILSGMGPSVFESKNIRLRLKADQALPKFINYQLLAFGHQHFSNNAQQVVGMASISQKQLADFPIVLAPLDQQQHIVAEIEKQFSRLFDAVANLKRVKANLKRYKAAVLKAAVEGRLVETEAERARKKTPSPLAGEGRGEGAGFETGEQLLQRILETRRSQWQGKGKYKEPAAPDTTDLPELPEGWVWATVDSVCEQIVDCPHSTARFQNDGLPCIDTTWMTTDGLVIERARYVDDATYQERIARLEPKPGDIVFAREGTIGTAILVPDRMKPCLGQRVMLLRSSMYLNGLLRHVLHSETVKRQYRVQALGSTVAHINVGDVKAFKVPVPPIAEQHRIVAEVDRRLSLLRETEAQVDANLQRAERLRQSILATAFSGRFA